MSDKRDMSGVLFKNGRKQTDSHPDYTGTCTINGEEFYMSAWLKTGKAGKFMSFAYKPKENRKDEPAPKQDAFGLAGDEQEDIPF